MNITEEYWEYSLDVEDVIDDLFYILRKHGYEPEIDKKGNIKLPEGFTIEVRKT